MDPFHWIVVPISTVLGLTVARVLSSYASMFKQRATVRFDWLPILFAGAVLGEGLQFWWALLELSALKTWSLAAFTLLLAMVMALFLAAALVVPADSDRDLRAAFERDGRWALIVLAIFHILAIIANAWFWQTPLLSWAEGLLLLLAALCLLAGLTQNRRRQQIVALLYVAASVYDTLSASVSAY